MQFEILIWLNSLKYFITTFNFILRTVCISLVQWIGYPTETQQLDETTKLTFYLQFFNTVFLLLLVNADLSEQFFNSGIFRGTSGDFDATWFKVSGNTMVGTLIFILLWPIIEFFVFFGLRWLPRFLDHGFSSDPYNTRVTNLQAYVDNYSGPLYLMHYKYAHILNIVFVAFTFGYGIPILFPIAAVALFFLYVVEKSMLYYCYRLPPMYDERLSQSVLNQMSYAPLFLLSFGYWMASNKQMLSNDHLVPKNRMTDADLTEHTLANFFTGDFLNAPAWPLLVLFVILALN